MTRSEWIHKRAIYIQREEQISDVVALANALEKSGAAPWDNEPSKPLGVTPTPFNPLTAKWGEHAYAIFCRTFRRNLSYVELADAERRAWEDVAATIRTEAGTLDVGDKVTYLIETAVQAEREACAGIANSQAVIDGYGTVVARNIRDEIRRRT